MELRQLEYFLTIIDCGAFSRAALKLLVGQPMLSRQIRALEDEVGAALYHRTGRGIALTEAGRLLEKYAREILRTTGEAQREISALGLSPTGSVTIAMPPSVGAALAVGIVQTFCQRFPKVNLCVRESFSAYVLDWLIAGTIDIAVLYDVPRLHALPSDPLLTDELFLFGPVCDPAQLGDGPVPLARLQDIPLILASRPHGLRILLEELMQKIGCSPNVHIEIDALHSNLRLVESGLGYTVISYSCAHQLVEAGKIRCWRIVEPTISRSLVVASSTQRPSTKASRALVEIVRQQAQALENMGWHKPAS